MPLSEISAEVEQGIMKERPVNEVIPELNLRGPRRVWPAPVVATSMRPELLDCKDLLRLWPLDAGYSPCVMFKAALG